MEQQVSCIKFGRILPGLDQPPFPGDLGHLIYENVSKQAWTMWTIFQTQLIYQFNLMLDDPSDYNFLIQQTENFFFETAAATPEEWFRENPARIQCRHCWTVSH